MRITLDTNILIRANQNATGPCHKLLRLIIEQGHILILSQSLLYELEEALRYPRVQRLTRMTEEQARDYLETLKQFAFFAKLGPAVSFPIADADDWMVLRTAIEGNAEILCSNDRDLRNPSLAPVYSEHRIRLLSDLELLHLLTMPAA